MAEYIGRRIVPTHGGVWNETKEYEELVIVLDEESGDSYISRIPVPSGTALDDEEYWMLFSIYSEQIQEALDAIEETSEEMVAYVDKTAASLTEYVQDTATELTEQVEAAEELTESNKDDLNERMETIEARLDANVTASTDSDADYAAEVIDARVDEEANTYDSLGAHVRAIGNGTGLIDQTVRRDKIKDVSFDQMDFDGVNVYGFDSLVVYKGYQLSGYDTSTFTPNCTEGDTEGVVYDFLTSELTDRGITKLHVPTDSPLTQAWIAYTEGEKAKNVATAQIMDDEKETGYYVISSSSFSAYERIAISLHRENAWLDCVRDCSDSEESLITNWIGEKDIKDGAVTEDKLGSDVTEQLALIPHYPFDLAKETTWIADGKQYQDGLIRFIRVYNCDLENYDYGLYQIWHNHTTDKTRHIALITIDPETYERVGTIASYTAANEDEADPDFIETIQLTASGEVVADIVIDWTQEIYNSYKDLEVLIPEVLSTDPKPMLEVDDDSVSEDSIQSEAVTADKIADQAVRREKIKDVTFDQVDFDGVNVYGFDSLAVYKGYQLFGYDTSAFTPNYKAADTEGVVYDFLTSELTDRGITELRVPTDSPLTQAWIAYTEGEAARNRATSLITDDEIETGYYVISSSIFSAYERIAISFAQDNACLQCIRDYSDEEEHLATNWIQEGDIRDEAVSTDKIADGAVTTLKIAENAVTLEQMSFDGVNLFGFESLELYRGLQLTGYDTTTFLPIFTELSTETEGVICDFLVSELTDRGITDLHVPTDSPLTQAWIAYTEGETAKNVSTSQITDEDKENGYYTISGTTLAKYERVCISFYQDNVWLKGVRDYSDMDERLITNWISESEIRLNSSIETVLPTKIRVASGVEMNVYFQNIVRYLNADKCHLVRGTGSFDNYSQFARWTPDDDSSDFSSYFRFYIGNTAEYRLQSDKVAVSCVPSDAGEGTTKTVLLIGDSLTDADAFSSELVNLFGDDAMDITLIGTLGSGSNLNEGRSGWRAYTYVKCAEGSDDLSNLSYTNPFYNPDTETFDFAYYMEEQGYESLDYVFICLGTNDIARGNYDSDEELAEYWDCMIESIHEYDADIKIGLWLPPTRSLMEGRNRLAIDSSLKMNKWLIERYDGREDEGIYLVPVYLNVDPYHDYKYSEVSVSARNTSFTMVVDSDSVHPSTIGYCKIADVIYSYIKYFASLDEEVAQG